MLSKADPLPDDAPPASQKDASSGSRDSLKPKNDGAPRQGLNAASSNRAPKGLSLKSRRILPCGHSRQLLDLVDSDFDVVCPDCFGHFFEYAFVPYTVFVGLFAGSYFWRPLALQNMLFVILALFCMCYVGAILRHRRSRLLTAMAVFVPVALLVLERAVSGEIRLDVVSGRSFVALSVLALVLLVAFGRGVGTILSDHAEKGALLLSVTLILSIASSIVSLAMNIGAAVVPSLQSYPSFAALLGILNRIQTYRLAAVVLALGVVTLWAGGLAVNDARESIGTDHRPLQHSFWQEVRRLALFFRLVVVQIVQRVLQTFRKTLHHLIVAAASSLRVILLIASATGVSVALYRVAMLTAAIWENEFFLLQDAWSLLGLAYWIGATWVTCWAFIVVAFVGDLRNEASGLQAHAVHTSLIIRYNFLRSTPIYWFYLSLVIFASWFLVSAARLFIHPDAGMPLGVVFVTYLVLVTSFGVVWTRGIAPTKA
ncbi:MAG: hypothetical protein V4550_15690 [Gemmatimonadota bacterium]